MKRVPAFDSLESAVFLAFVLGAALWALGQFGTTYLVVMFFAVPGLFIGIRYPPVIAGICFTGVLLDASVMTERAIFGLPITLAKLFVLIGLLAWFCHSCFWRKPMVKWHPLAASMCLLIVSGSLSLMVAHFRSEGMLHIVQMGMCIVLSVLVCTILEEEDIKPLLRFMALSLFLMFVIVYFQGNVGTRDVERVFLEAAEKEWGDYERISGTLADPNEYCAMLIIMTPLLFCALLEDEHRLAKWLAGGLGMAFSIAIINSMSRAGMLLGIACMIATAWYFRRRISLMATAIGLAFAATVPAFSKFETASERWSGLWGVETGFTGLVSLRERAKLMEAGFETFKENWVWGVGSGNLRYHHGFVTDNLNFKVIHNSYLQFAAEHGIPGILAMMVIGWILCRTLYQSIRYASTPYQEACAVGLTIGMVGWAGMAATLDLSSQSQAYYVLGLVMAVHHGIMKGPKVSPQKSQPEIKLVGL